jgi:hypothetical protein
MHKIIPVCLAAIALGGCNWSAAQVDAVASQVTVADNSAKADAAERIRFVCAWARGAGLDKLTVGAADTAATKKQVAGLHAAHKATCATDVAQATAPATPPPVPITGKP